MNTIAERNAIVLSVAFFLVFAGWTASSSFATRKNGDVGANSIGIVYLVFTLSNFIASPIIQHISIKLVLFISSLTYGLYIASNIFLYPLQNNTHKYILYLLSALLGSGACCIWISQSMFITHCSNTYEHTMKLPKNSKLGYFNGLFYMIYLFNRLTGYLISAVLFSFHFSSSFVFSILSIICCVGCCCFFFIHDQSMDFVPDNKQKRNETTLNIIKLSVMNTISVWKNFRFWCLFGLTIFSGVDMQFNSGIYPLLFKDEATTFGILSIYGLMCSLSSLIFGKSSDKYFSRLSVICIGAACKLCCYSFFYLNLERISIIYYDKTGVNELLYPLIFCGILMGIGDGCLLTQISSIYPILLGKRAEVFANIKLWQSGTAAIYFFLHSSLTIQIKIKLNLLLLIIGCVPILCFTSIRNALDYGKQSDKK